MLHGSDDSDLFRQEAGEQGNLPIYEAKYIWQFDHRFAMCEVDTRNVDDGEKANPSFSITPQFWADSVLTKARFARFLREWHLVYRVITNSSNYRTLVAAVIPKSAIVNTANLVIPENAKAGAEMVTLLNSFALDYVVRNKIGGASLNKFILQQLPTPSPSELRTASSIEFWKYGLELSYTSFDLADFANECGYRFSPFRWDQERRFLLRCELDAAYFHLYGIERDDVDYIMETFPIVKRKDKEMHGEYRTKRVILEIYDEMAEAIRTGVAYKTRLDPPPADPRVAHPPKEEIDVELLRWYVLLYLARRYQELTYRDPLKVFTVKLVYIAELSKQIAQKYPWKLQQFGPYPEGKVFDKVLESLRSQSLLEPQREESQVGDEPIVPTASSEAKLKEIESKFDLSTVRSSLDKVVDDFKNLDGKAMELRATLIYLHKTNPQWKFDELAAGLKKEKGKRFGDDAILTAVAELQKQDYVATTVG
jgi:hypothetical protein